MKSCVETYIKCSYVHMHIQWSHVYMYIRYCAYMYTVKLYVHTVELCVDMYIQWSLI